MGRSLPNAESKQGGSAGAAPVGNPRFERTTEQVVTESPLGDLRGVYERVSFLRARLQNGKQVRILRVRGNFLTFASPKSGITPVYALYCTGVLRRYTSVYTWLDIPRVKL